MDRENRAVFTSISRNIMLTSQSDDRARLLVMCGICDMMSHRVLVGHDYYHVRDVCVQ